MRQVNPPQEWIDPDTGRRVIRLTDEPNSKAFYFNENEFTPDGNEMVYTAPDGIHVLNLATRKTRLLVPIRGHYRTIAVGKKTPTIYYLNQTEHAVYGADIETGATKKLVTLPPNASGDTINADETLVAGGYIEGPQPPPPPKNEPKEEMMEKRLAGRYPMVLFTMDLRTGQQKILLHSTNWLNHLLFSPTDPSLLMYCHEGPWHKVDRIWTIRTDGSQNTLIHRRTMAMEIAGHEFWGPDGQTIWYDWQYPRGEDFFLAGYNLQTHRRTAYHMQRNEWSIHFNVTEDLSLFCGDGGDPGQVAKAPDGEWIYLFRPQMLRVSSDTLDAPGFWQPGVFHAERLVNMSKHHYHLEPNVRFSPDKKLVIFTSNMFGDEYVFGVEVGKAP